MFKRNKLADAIATVLVSTAACGATTTALAQDGTLEEVIVTGIRGSLQRSMDIKRDSAGVVDAISAEDIGKFPDTNLAESLQRITGVSIDRRNGEGYQITVRGFGPQFNLVTLNGRTMPTSGLNFSKSGGSNPSSLRSFDMSNLAAEGVAGAEVYKTSRADIASGGIGATVNLKTRRPFDNEGFTATVGAKMINDTSVRVGSDWTPEFSTFLSWSDDKFGASLAYTKQDRDSTQAGVFTNSWSAYSGGYTDASFFEGIPFDGGGVYPDINAADVNVINAPTVGQQTNATPGIRYYVEDHERTRENTQVTFQFRPSDAITATLDYTKAEQDLFFNGAEFSLWFGGGAFPTTDVQLDGNSQVASPVYYWSENPSGLVRDIAWTQNQFNVKNELEDTGLNVEFTATDSLSFELDYHSASASSLPGADDIIGSYFNIAIGAQGVWSQGYDNSGDLPLLVGNFALDNRPGGTAPGFPPGGSDPNAIDVGDLGSTVRQGWWSRAWNDIDETRVSGKWQLDDKASIDFGIESTTMEATQRSSFLQETLEGNWGVSTPGDVPPNMMESFDFASLFDGYSTTLSPESQAFFNQAGAYGSNSGATAQVMTQGYIAKDVKQLGMLLSANNNLPWAPNPVDSTFRTIKEDVTAFYLQYSNEFEVGGMPLGLVAGVRYEDTDVTSISQVAAAEIIWQGDNDFITQSGAAADADPVVGSGSYSHTLPSLTLSLGIRDDLIGRFAYSTTISRPDYSRQVEGINGIQPPNGGPTILVGTPGTANNGNPNLKPLESDNFDLSLEWYYGESSYASIGYFKKDVPNFVGLAVADQPVATTLDPSNGPRAQAAIDALNAASLPINQQNLFAMVASLSTEGQGCTTVDTDGAACGDAFGAWTYEGATGWEDNVDLTAVATDPQYIARVSFPVDSQSASLDGWELALQHFFGETGFGVQLNYTIVDGDIGFDITGDPTTTQFALTGLSDSYNLVGIFEKYDWSVRLAYNWRDAFLVTPTGAANEPQFTEAHAQLDLNVSYNITDDLSVSFEGINLNGEDQRDYARTERQLIRLQILDARYALGVRYSF